MKAKEGGVVTATGFEDKGKPPVAVPMLDLPPGYPSNVPSWARPRSPAATSTGRVGSRSNSRASSLSPSPITTTATSSDEPGREDVDDDGGQVHDLQGETAPVLTLSAGCQPDSVYRQSLPYWRYWIRKLLVRSLEWESPVLGRIQEATRSPFWDTFFIWSSIFGTHSAFMVGLPLFWWFGHAYEGRGLLNILAAGVYAASFFKDLLCVPRPYTPPVTRLSISSHGLEYGFPSTHSTNAVSLSLYFAELFLRGYGESFLVSDLEWYTILGVGACAFYAISVVLGRIYCGMHSIMDCIAGSLLGVGIWYGNLLVSPYYEQFLTTTGYTVPAVVVPLCLLLVSTHPQPVDNCPCFEDVIAFVAVAAGMAIGQWYSYLHSSTFTSTQSNWMYHHLATSSVWNAMGMDSGPYLSGNATASIKGHAGSGFHSSFADYSSLRPIPHATAWTLVAIAKLVLGIGTILAWRIVAKKTLYVILPPIFNVVEPWFSLPRRYYQKASSYKEIQEHKPLQPVPSVLDLTELGSSPLDARLARGSRSRAASASIAIRGRSSDDYSTSTATGYLSVADSTTASRRPRRATAHFFSPPSPSSATSQENSPVSPTFSATPSPATPNKTMQHLQQQQQQQQSGKQDRNNKDTKDYPLVQQIQTVHYNVDVLTKVGVYSGIGCIATLTIPWLFRCIGLD